MEREHLIIIALILVALYMMNTTKDTVKAISPMARIRYTDGPMDGSTATTKGLHIRTRREGFTTDKDQDALNQNFGNTTAGPGVTHIRIRHGDRDYGKGHFIKSHVRHNNRNNMFSGMMGTDDCEPFRFENVCDGPNPPPC